MAAPSLSQLVSARIAVWNQQNPQRQIDPAAALSVSAQEGLGGGIGDGGHAFGPFQLNDAGGVITGKFPGQSQQQTQAWATSPAGVDYALAGIGKAAGGLHGADAVHAIVGDTQLGGHYTGFERPANEAGEIARALGQPVAAPSAVYGPPAPAAPGAAPAARARTPLAAALNQPSAPDTHANFMQALLGAVGSTGQLDPQRLMAALASR